MTDIERRRARSAAPRTPARARPKPRSRGRTRPTASPASLREQAAPAHARDAVPHRKKLEFPALDPKCPADTAGRLLLAALGDTMRAQERAILEDDDAGAVHDLRVSIRRARTLLGQLGDVFPRASTQPLRDGLRHLAESSGPVRDFDIMLQALGAARRKLPAAERGALESLCALLAGDRALARQALLEGLRSPRHARLSEAWGAFVATPRPPSARPPVTTAKRDGDEVLAALMPIAIIAGEAIERAWRRLVRDGRKVDDSSPPEALHQVRIDGKKLRYLLELFRSTFAEVELGPVISSLKDLQDCLGALNDAAVVEEILRRVAVRVSAPEVDAGTLLLIGRLIERSSVARAAARRRFRERFASLTAKDNRRRIRSVADA